MYRFKVNGVRFLKKHNKDWLEDIKDAHSSTFQGYHLVILYHEAKDYEHG